MAVAYRNYMLHVQREKQRRKLHRTSIRDVTNPFEIPDREFFRLYRCNKDMVIYLCSELEEELAPKNILGLPVHIKVLTSLHYLGTGHYQRGIGQDHVVTVAQTTVSKYLDQFTKAIIAKLMGRWINFPTNNHGRAAVARTFAQKFGLPDVLGAIDCTHVEIFPPPQAHGAAYRNRHNYTSINTQLVVDANCRIIHINARYPGSVHDAFIYNYSNIRIEMRRLFEHRIGTFYLIGDSGYPLEPWLMTPVLHAPPDSPSQRYTDWHCKARNTVERTNGYLKGSFRCIGGDRLLRYMPEKASQLIYTCAVLYNMKLHYRVPVEYIEPVRDPVLEARVPAPQNLHRIAEGRRNALIEQYFT